jgi:predicted DNA-binding protein
MIPKKTAGELRPNMVQVRMSENEKRLLEKLKYETRQTYANIIREAIRLYDKELKKSKENSGFTKDSFL